MREAQALRYRVFSQAFEARLAGAEEGLDRDDYDPHCLHIGVRDRGSGALVATARLLDRQAARALGRFYSEGEFRLRGPALTQGPLLEIGRTCVDAAYRNGATIGVLWSELAEVEIHLLAPIDSRGKSRGELARLSAETLGLAPSAAQDAA